MAIYVYKQTDELYHYGVKGMKWGVRRYRNEDGSLTDAGMKRNLAIVKKAARDYSKQHGRRPSLGGTVGKDELTTSVADKVHDLQKRRNIAYSRLGDARARQELEDHKKFDDFYEKNKRYPTETEHKKMMQDTYRKYKKDIDKYEKEANKIDDDYRSAVKQVVDETLGKYGNKNVSYRSGKRKVSKSAEDWLATEIEWGNEIRRD